MQDLILHHYEGSPFAEKVIRVLAFKGLPWRSVKIPVVMPRPDYVKLTGGYRRSPVLQIGADIICDTNLILQTLERIKPEPTLYPQGSDALSYAISHWFEPTMFQHVSPVRFQSIDDVEGVFKGAIGAAAFTVDRRPFMAPLMDTSRLAEFFPSAIAQVKEYATFIDDQLRKTGAFLCGEEASHADFSAFHPLWWLLQEPNRLGAITETTNVEAWIERLSGFSGPAPQQLTSENALAIARDNEADPRLTPEDAKFCPSDGSSEPVSIFPNDYGVDPAEGERAYHGRDHIGLRRQTQELGTLMTHFPKWGYDVRQRSKD